MWWTGQIVMAQPETRKNEEASFSYLGVVAGRQKTKHRKEKELKRERGERRACQ
jgi:hypothetical protein